MENGNVLGIGGLFFRSKEPEALVRWYKDCLGLTIATDFPGGMFDPKDLPEEAYSIWSVFPSDTTYLGDRSQGFMINFVVDDVAAVLEKVRAAGGEVSGGPEDTEYGVFGWVVDPEGNKIELWKPKPMPANE